MERAAQEDRRRQDEQRRQRQQQQQKKAQTQTTLQTQVAAHLQESIAQTLNQKSSENQHSKQPSETERGQVYVPTGTIVKNIYRYINSLNNSHHENGKPIDKVEFQDRQIKNESIQKYEARVGARIESVAMQKYKAHSEAMSSKVKSQVDAQCQGKTQGQTR